MEDQDLMQDYNDYRHEYDGWDDGPLDPQTESLEDPVRTQVLANLLKTQAL
jgi:hypothetical protein